MVDQGSIYLILQKIAEQNHCGQLSGDKSGADKYPEGIQALCRKILDSVLTYAEGLSLDEAEGAVSSEDGSHELSPGYQAGRFMAQGLLDDGFSPQVFFEAHKEVRTFLLDELANVDGEDKERGRHRFMVVESFMGDLAAGFALEKMRIVRTISRRRQQEARRYILQEKKRYGAIFYQMEEPSFVVDNDLRLIDVNPACTNFFGKSPDELIGSKCCDVIGQGICKGCPLKETIDNGGSFSNFEITLPIGINGEEGEDKKRERELLLAGSTLGEGVEGTGSGGIVIIQDITDRKKIEQELDEYRNWLEDFVDERTEELLDTNERLQEEIRERRKIERELIQASADLKRSNADLEQFAQVASHDLREPLMLVASFSERIVKGYSSVLDDRGRSYLDRIVKATDKLQNLVDALLQLSKVSISSGSFVSLEMNELVRDVVGDLDEMINQIGARVEVDDLHDLDGDAVQMRQLFQNLISNALKYNKEGITPSVMIRSMMVGETCEISVEDNGIGLKEEDAKRIFEPFVRLHDYDDYDGSGMGLATCQKIVNRHGGEIIARPKSGSGTVFIVRLPLRH
jgi:signal transduction histidine kinase